ncbi:MAG: single-stranded-DNA-specific exonuclease RecJ [Clostridia bacterium]
MTKILQRKNEIIDQLLIEKLSNECNLDSLLVKLLFSRGYDTKEKLNSYLYDTLDNLSSPFIYTNMDKVVERLKLAQKENKRILIYGDYDCDGVGAIAIMYLACKDANILVDYYIPTRASEGYGLNCEAILKISQDFAPDIMLTVDCGITSNKEVIYAQSLGIEIIVSDHHQLGNQIPDCLIVNPCLDPQNTPLCGAGVALKIVEGWLGKDIALRYIDICAISTIADVVPLIADNRIIAKYGMIAIQKGKCRKGIKELIIASNGDYHKLSTYDMAFKIAPRINASGRLNSADTSLTLLIEDDTTLISLLAKELEVQNTKRQQINTDIYNEAKIMLESYDLGLNRIIVLYNENWNEGVLGIVAAKITEEFNRPTILLTNNEDKLKGSARSIAAIDIHKAISTCQEYLIGFGGHAMAAGMQMEQSNLNKFIISINQYLWDNYTDDDFEKLVKYDFEVPIKSFNSKLGKQLTLLEPFGCGNPKPVFYDDAYQKEFKQIGKTTHIKSTSSTGDLVLFGQYQNMDFYNKNTLKIAYTHSVKVFRERDYNQFMPKAIVPILENLPDDSKVIVSYLQTLLYSNYNNSRNNIPAKKTDKAPCLYITFSKENFNNFIIKHTNYDKFIYKNDYISNKNSIVLCPAKDFDFSFYNKIIVLEELGDNYLEFLLGKVQNVKVESKIKPFQNNLFVNMDNLREDFTFFKNILNNGYQYNNAIDFYTYCKENDYQREFYKFLISFYIFLDVELILKNENDILVINNHKVDLTQSNVYKSLTD